LKENGDGDEKDEESDAQREEAPEIDEAERYQAARQTADPLAAGSVLRRSDKPGFSLKRKGERRWRPKKRQQSAERN
jgi:hypothetical protein